MDWKKELDKKLSELNIKGGDINVRSNNIDNNNTRSRVHRIQDAPQERSSVINSPIKVEDKNKNIINHMEGKNMIGLEGALSDVDNVINKGIYNDRETKKEVKLVTDLEKIGAIVKILLKFLSTMRSNQLLTEEDKVKIKADKLARDAKKTTQK